jgi:hypothetical protein
MINPSVAGNRYIRAVSTSVTPAYRPHGTAWDSAHDSHGTSLCYRHAYVRQSRSTMRAMQDHAISGGSDG